MIEERMPEIAIAGGGLLLFALVCIALCVGRRRRDREAPRRTSFHLTVIDPRVARQRRAAWECSSPPREELVVVEEIEMGDIEVEEIEIPIEVETSPPGLTMLGYIPARYIPRAMLPARPPDWEPSAPSVTARMRAAKRT